MLRGDVGGFPAKDYVEAALMSRAVLPAKAYLYNGFPRGDVLDAVGFTTDRSGFHHVAEVVAVDPATNVAEIIFRARDAVTRDLRSYGPAAHGC
jgi:hypothetical protein